MLVSKEDLIKYASKLMFDMEDNEYETLEKESIKGDINKDGKVSLADYTILVNDYTLCRDESLCNERSDLDEDGKVTLSDYSLFMQIYNSL